jgi:hypothetical protein
MGTGCLVLQLNVEDGVKQFEQPAAMQQHDDA